MRNTLALVLSLLVLPLHPLAGQSPVGADTVPRATGGQIAAQTLLGGAGGLVGSIGLAYLGSQSGTDAGTDDPGLTGAIIGFSVGALVGTSLGVYLGGKAGPRHGSYGTTLLGTVVGFGLFVAGAAEFGDADYAPFWVMAYTLPTAGALIGYHASARSTHQRLKALERVGVGVASMGRDRVGLVMRIEF